ncbi:hypothetical protein D3C71_2025490 [compost metagenome]
MQGLVDHGCQVKAFAQAHRAVAGKGFQVAGKCCHAREHLFQWLQRLPRFVMATMVKQQAQGFQLHTLGGQRLVDFVGHGR